MAFNLKAASDFWVRVFGDTVAPGDGSTASLPTRLDQYNSDMGRSQTIITDDGDLRTIDTSAEALSADPTVNTTGAATTKYSLLFLLRWSVRLAQLIAANTQQTFITRNGASQAVTLDTSTPANNRGLPVVLMSGPSSAPFDTNAGIATAQTLRVATVFCTTCTPSNVAVTTTSSTAIAANSVRVSLVIVNTGINDVTIRRSATAVIAGIGIVIKAGGGTYEINATNLYTGAITAITAAGSSTLAVEECV